MCPFKKTRKEKNRKIQCDKLYLNRGSISASNAGRFYLSSRVDNEKSVSANCPDSEASF